MTKTPRALAADLLDAQVAWTIDELTGPRLTAVIERDVDAVLTVAAQHRVEELVDRDDAKATLRRAAEITRDSEVVADLSVEIPVLLHSLPEASDHQLHDVVHRPDVEALVAAFLTLDRLHERGLDRIAGSPLMGAVASRFVARIVSDVLQQNRDWAQKVPGVSSLFSIGGSAVGRIRSVTDKQTEALLGEATGRGAEFAIRRTNSAILGLVGEAPLHGAAMESWDLQAREPVSDLSEYLHSHDVRHLAEVVSGLLGRVGGTAYAGVVLDACVDLFFDRYGAQDGATFLAEAGISSDDLVTVAERHLRPLVEALRDSGDLDRVVRARLEPFYTSTAVLALLRATRAAPTRKAPATKAPARKAPATKAPAKKAPARKAPATKAPAKKAPAKKA